MKIKNISVPVLWNISKKKKKFFLMFLKNMALGYTDWNYHEIYLTKLNWNVILFQAIWLLNVDEFLAKSEVLYSECS